METPRILLVEQDEALGKVAARYLRLHGFAVTVIPDPQLDHLLGYDCVVLGLEVSLESGSMGDCPIIPFASYCDPSIRAPPKELVRRIWNAVSRAPA